MTDRQDFGRTCHSACRCSAPASRDLHQRPQLLSLVNNEDAQSAQELRSRLQQGTFASGDAAHLAPSSGNSSAQLAPAPTTGEVHLQDNPVTSPFEQLPPAAKVKLLGMLHMSAQIPMNPLAAPCCDSFC